MAVWTYEFVVQSKFGIEVRNVASVAYEGTKRVVTGGQLRVSKERVVTCARHCDGANKMCTDQGI